MSTIHLVTTCSKSKHGEVLDTIFPSNITNIEEAFKEWSTKLKSRFSEGKGVTEAQKLYKGSHWNTALKIRESRTDVSLWVLSAGLGLRHSSDLAVPYEASFSDMPHLSSTLWDLLTKKPILPGRTPSLKTLLLKNNTDKFVVSASPVYLKAVEHDLLEGIIYLSNPKAQVIIATSQGYSGCLKPYVKYGEKCMMRTLNSNMTTLNIKHAQKIILSMERT